MGVFLDNFGFLGKGDVKFRGICGEKFVLLFFLRMFKNCLKVLVIKD